MAGPEMIEEGPGETDAEKETPAVVAEQEEGNQGEAVAAVALEESAGEGAALGGSVIAPINGDLEEAGLEKREEHQDDDEEAAAAAAAAAARKKKKRKKSGGSTTSTKRRRGISVDDALSRLFQTSFCRGEYVECEWDDKSWFRARIERCGKVYDVIYDSGEEELGLGSELMRRPLASVVQKAGIFLVTKKEGSKVCLEAIADLKKEEIWLDETEVRFLETEDRDRVIDSLREKYRAKLHALDPAELALRLSLRLEDLRRRWPTKRDLKGVIALAAGLDLKTIEAVLAETKIEEHQIKALAAILEARPDAEGQWFGLGLKKKKAFSEFFGVAGSQPTTPETGRAATTTAQVWTASLDAEFFECEKDKDDEMKPLEIGVYRTEIAAARARDWALLHLFYADPQRVLAARKQLVLNFADSLQWWVDHADGTSDTAKKLSSIQSLKEIDLDALAAELRPREFTNETSQDDVSTTSSFLVYTKPSPPATRNKDIIISHPNALETLPEIQENLHQSTPDDLYELLWTPLHIYDERKILGLNHYIREAALTRGGGEAAALDAYQEKKASSNLFISSRKPLLPSLPNYEDALRTIFVDEAVAKKRSSRSKPHILPVREHRQRIASEKARAAIVNKRTEESQYTQDGMHLAATTTTTNNRRSTMQTAHDKHKTSSVASQSNKRAKLSASSTNTTQAHDKVIHSNNTTRSPFPPPLEKNSMQPSMSRRPQSTGNTALDAALAACKPRQRARPMLTNIRNGRILAGPSAPTWDRLAYYVRDHPNWRLQRGVVPPLTKSASTSTGTDVHSKKKKDAVLEAAEKRIIAALRAVDEASRHAALAAWQYSATLQAREEVATANSVQRSALDAAKAIAALGGAIADLRDPLPDAFRAPKAKQPPTTDNNEKTSSHGTTPPLVQQTITTEESIANNINNHTAASQKMLASILPTTSSLMPTTPGNTGHAILCNTPLNMAGSVRPFLPPLTSLDLPPSGPFHSNSTSNRFAQLGMPPPTFLGSPPSHSLAGSMNTITNPTTFPTPVSAAPIVQMQAELVETSSAWENERIIQVAPEPIHLPAESTPMNKAASTDSQRDSLAKNNDITSIEILSLPKDNASGLIMPPASILSPTASKAFDRGASDVEEAHMITSDDNTPMPTEAKPSMELSVGISDFNHSTHPTPHGQQADERRPTALSYKSSNEPSNCATVLTSEQPPSTFLTLTKTTKFELEDSSLPLVTMEDEEKRSELIPHPIPAIESTSSSS